MNIKYKNYVIEIIDEICYSLNSADNIYNYDKVFIVGTETECPTKYGIKIKTFDDEIIMICPANNNHLTGKQSLFAQ